MVLSVRMVRVDSLRRWYISVALIVVICSSAGVTTMAFVMPLQHRDPSKSVVGTLSPRTNHAWGVAASSSIAAAALSPSVVDKVTRTSQKLTPIQSKFVRAGMILYVASMCLALPLTLIPQKLLFKMGWVTKKRKELMAVSTAQFCSRFLLRLIPFCKLQIIPCDPRDKPEPAIWVCNHVSMLDIFILLGADRKLRGRNKRPIKIVYWKGLEDNPVTRLLFRQSGFIPVQMADNGNGNDNEYDVKSFKKLLRDAKEAFQEGFDIGVLPEGQLNPTPERGLLPVYPGAYSLAKMSKRPVYMMALYGTHHLWHAIHGMTCEERVVKVRAYPVGRRYQSSKEFIETFAAVVGHFGANGYDLPDDELNGWMTGRRESLDEPTTAAATAEAFQIES